MLKIKKTLLLSTLLGITTLFADIKYDVVVTNNLTALYTKYDIENNNSYFYIENDELSEWIIKRGLFDINKDKLIIPLNDLTNPCDKTQTKFRLSDYNITFCDNDKEIYHENSDINVVLPLYNKSVNTNSLFFQDK